MTLPQMGFRATLSSLVLLYIAGALSGCASGSDDGMTDGTGGAGPTSTAPPDFIPVQTVACAGTLPADDVSAAPHRVTAGATSWGALPHFWTTYGLGRIGLYLDQALLAPEFQTQDRTTHDGRKWSAVLREQTLEAVQKLELRSVRAHGLFHDDIGIYSEDTSGNAVYDFTRSDDIFDFLVENDIAPIIELAPMPSALAADPSQTVFDWNMIVSPPKDYAKWQALVQAFVQHSVERYGAEVVQQWYFEVWNEPECCSNKFWKGTLAEYFQLYDASAAGVRAVLPSGRMGGPVSSQAAELAGNSMAGVQFLDHVTQNGSPLDFFTFHTWAFIQGSVGGYFQGLDLLDSYGKTDVQIAVTEFGPTWEFGLRGVEGTAGTEPEWEPQETVQGAAFVAQTYANIAQRCAQEDRRFPITYAWWTLSDVFDEGYEDPGDYVLEENPFIGAMGLYNREGIKKPAYNAFKFLAQLGDEQRDLTVVGEGDVGGIAARDTTDGGVQVIVYNGQNPGEGYRDDLYYAEAPAQEIGVTVLGLNPEAAYNVTAYRVDDVRGNAWGAWDGLGRPTMANMDDAAWQTLRDSMESLPEPVGQALCGSTFSKTFSLSSPGVLLLTLEPALP
jgi:xylan 1,4-beta-xylosidase